ncbi:MAG: hypothetical protein GAK28_01964 [Luteibacter sp.]|uniref:hypothetical protein n=1 Tax=Luteibacter sp. TaxID=1886636 RepID=UPI001384BC7F|nr:hypothetical protein [Luteibacter sp.]KAF1007325.1 MAG: hypothetical protein GAK28_01964 [Luteibacter sp.]
MHLRLPTLLASLRTLSRELLGVLGQLETRLRESNGLAPLSEHGLRPHASALPPPRIPASEIPGGLGIGDVGPGVEHDVAVTIGPWDGFEDGDHLRLYMGEAVIAERPMSAADRFRIITLEVPVAAIRAQGDGAYLFMLEVSNVLGAPPIYSLPLAIWIKTSRPGGHDPQPDTETINENLAPAHVIPPGLIDLDQAKVVVRPRPETPTTGPWVNATEGDRLRVSWHGRYVDWGPLTAAHLTEPEVNVSIPRELIEAVGRGEAQVSYRILDRVSNSSLWAPYATVDVPIDRPGAPPAPWVRDTVDDLGLVLRLADLQSRDVTVEVKQGHGGQAGDRLRVLWKGVAADEQPVPPYTTDWRTLTTSDALEMFTVPYAHAEVLGEGRVTVTYELQPTGKEVVTSKRLTLLIEGKAQSLKPPLLRDVDDVLDIARFPTGATMAAPWQPDRIPAGSIVTFRWVGQVEGQSKPEYADGANDTEVTLPYNVMRQLVGGPVRIQYQVETFANDPVDAASLLRYPRYPHARPRADGRAILAIVESPWITLQVIETVELAPPIFPSANRAKQILYADLVDGTDIEIPDYANRQADDIILLMFECFENDDPGYTHDPQTDIPIPKGHFQLGPFEPGDEPPPWRYHIPRERIFFDRNGHPRYHLHARYSVTARDNPSRPILSESDFVRINLLGQPPIR